MMRKAFILLTLACLVSATAYAQITSMSGRSISRKEIDTFLQKEMQELQVPGLSVAVINHGRVVYHRAFGVTGLETGRPVDDQTIFEAASLSKHVFFMNSDQGDAFNLKLSELMVNGRD